MSLSFILILLLVIGVVFANIALLRFGSKPMPLKNNNAKTSATIAADQGISQAAATSALPLTTTPVAKVDQHVGDTDQLNAEHLPNSAPDAAPGSAVNND